MQLASLFLAAAFAVGPADGESEYPTLNHPTGEIRPYTMDSGSKLNAASQSATVYSGPVTVEGASWLRLYFGKVQLGEGSTVRMTSLQDGEVQELDSAGLALWGNTSAYFNGDSVLVEVIAGPKTTDNQVTVENIGVDFPHATPVGSGGQCGICGATDDRIASSQLWTGRLLPAGCTASVISIDSCLVSAGHCIGGSMVVQFNVPPSQPNCNITNPPVADQFPCTVFDFNNNGPGDDWSVIHSNTNNLGQRPFDRYGVLREVSALPGTPGATVVVTGYGVDQTCVQSQTQRTSNGPICTSQAFLYTFQVDLTGGNSGSALVRQSDNTIIGIVTHCPCCNIATKVTNSDFSAARSAACALQPPSNNACANAIAITAEQTNFNTFGATTDGPALPPSCDEGTGTSFTNDIWYTYTPQCTGTAFINTCFASNFNDRMAAYTGTCGNLTLVACSDDSCGSAPSLQFPIVCNQTYIIRLGTNGAGAGTGTIFTQCLGDCVVPNPCPWDLDGDGQVATTDFLTLLGAWGPNPGNPADFDSNGAVDTNDFLDLLAHWGPCP